MAPASLRRRTRALLLFCAFRACSPARVFFRVIGPLCIEALRSAVGHASCKKGRCCREATTRAAGLRALVGSRVTSNQRAGSVSRDGRRCCRPLLLQAHAHVASFERSRCVPRLGAGVTGAAALPRGAVCKVAVPTRLEATRAIQGIRCRTRIAERKLPAIWAGTRRPSSRRSLGRVHLSAWRIQRTGRLCATRANYAARTARTRQILRSARRCIDPTERV